MTEETKIRVRLDTTQAKSELSTLVKESAKTSNKIYKGIRATVGAGLGAVGLGTALGAGFSAIRGATESGVGDTIGEALGGIGKQIEEFFLGNLNEEARASRAAREETIQAFGAVAGHQNRIPPGARQFFESIRSLRVQEERGRELFEMEFRGPGIGEIVDRIMSKLGELLSDAVNALAEKLSPF